SGASIKEVQSLARHAKPQTTLTHYAKVSVRDLRGAIESLPMPHGADPEPEALVATGTDPSPDSVSAWEARRGRNRAEPVGCRRNVQHVANAVRERQHAQNPYN